MEGFQTLEHGPGCRPRLLRLTVELDAILRPFTGFNNRWCRVEKLHITWHVPSAKK